MKINWRAAADAHRVAAIEAMKAISHEISLMTFTYAPVNLTEDADALMTELRASHDEVQARVNLNNHLNSFPIDNGGTFNQEPAE